MNLETRILELLDAYMKEVTHTGTSLERNNENFFNKWFKEVPYLQDHPDHYGFYPIRKDPLERNIPWALLKGEGNKTVVLIHHSDTVDTEDFAPYSDKAYNRSSAEILLKEGKLPITEEVRKDLESGEWIFGRGSNDMKGGGCVHLALFEKYAEEDFKGNLLLIAVPDEENTSSGMRSAAYLLKELKEKHQFDYTLMLDVEPHDKTKKNGFTIYDGSIGKVMPLFLARGKLTHIAQIYTGLNPISLLSNIHLKTEIDPFFVEEVGTTVSPAPTWLYLKDRKTVYDVSLPQSAAGYMSVVPLKKSPREIVEYLKEVSIDAFTEWIETMKERYQVFKEKSPMDQGEISFKPLVYTYDELRALVEKDKTSKEKLKEVSSKISAEVLSNKLDRVEASIRLMEETLLLCPHKDPCVVIGFAAPYYPSVQNSLLPSKEKTDEYIKEVRGYLKEHFDLELEVQNYFTGICDLSYANFTESDETIDYIKNNLLLWGDVYSIPLEEIKQLSMPVLNVGAWGIDFHKYTERIHKEELLHKLPQITDFTIKFFLT